MGELVRASILALPAMPLMGELGSGGRGIDGDEESTSTQNSSDEACWPCYDYMIDKEELCVVIICLTR